MPFFRIVITGDVPKSDVFSPCPGPGAFLFYYLLSLPEVGDVSSSEPFFLRGDPEKIAGEFSFGCL